MFRPSTRWASSFRRRGASSVPRPSASAPPSTPLVLSRRVGPQTAFALGTSALALGGAAWYTNADTLSRSAGSSDSLFASWRRQLPTGLSPTLARQRFDEAYARAAAFVQQFPGNRLALIAAENWLELGEAKRTTVGLVAAFAGVWVAWRLPGRLNPGRWLAHDALNGKSVTLLTSVFSHRTLPHLAFNSLALYSFTTSCFLCLNHSDLLPRSTSRFEFLAFFVSAGLVSSLASHLWFSRVVAGRLLQSLPAQRVRQAILPSLGASGAVYACVTLTALAYPSTSVSLIFLPFFPLPIGAATGALVALDVVGLVRGWRMFDHAAHLAGAAAGVGYWAFGHDAFERLRGMMWEGQKREAEVEREKKRVGWR
ncbi:rhomboid family intramembrane serine protease [Rhodotorula paludigena]|uniref:rhomboid family intramembrane serine protease n=1 Tax=Rhodotorula paludigena TaxID=86838 RepID=UPI00317BF8BB